jgi:hypothetical protein
MNSWDDTGTEPEDYLKEEIEYIADYLADNRPLRVVQKFLLCMDNLQSGGIYCVPPNSDDMYAAIAECDESCQDCIQAIVSAPQEIRDSFDACIQLIRQISQ